MSTKGRAEKREWMIGALVAEVIPPGKYEIENAIVTISYPDHITLAHFSFRLPVGYYTVFQVAWPEQSSKRSSDGSSVVRAIDYINALVNDFKLPNVGHLSLLKLRTMGLGDVLFWTEIVDGKAVNGPNIRVPNEAWDPTAARPSANSFRRHLERDAPHQVARRFVKCFELLEVGFYSEVVIVAHAILDDVVQQMHQSQMKERGLDKTGSTEILRGIKENRLTIYLVALLKLVSGQSLDEMWDQGVPALKWFNRLRNEIAHGGHLADRWEASAAVFVSIKIIGLLNLAGLVPHIFTKAILRSAAAGFGPNPPVWAPIGLNKIKEDPVFKGAYD
ncbi:hypothetical protein [Mesorhizobium sp. CN2-181]|uniref:hypothetical protein n=1 Tax=Mesorhizobium yinganensis TaxID=3157707 RepID=UPI0032B84403